MEITGYQGIIQEFNLGVGFHVSITLWCKQLGDFFFFWGGGCCKPLLYALPLFCYISILDLLIWNTFFVNLFRMSSHLLNLKLAVQTNYPLAWMFFFCTLATAFPSSYRMKTVCSSWVWNSAMMHAHSTS